MCDDDKSKAAAVARIGAGLAARERGELLGRLRPCFARAQVWLQAGKYVGALVSGLPRRNGWTIAEHAGDRSPDRTQRLLNRACWDTFAAMGEVRRFAVAGLDDAARRAGRRRGLVAGVIDETGQVKQGTATAGVKRALSGVRGEGGERDHHGAPAVCAGEDRACAGRGAAVDPG